MKLRTLIPGVALSFLLISVCQAQDVTFKVLGVKGKTLHEKRAPLRITDLGSFSHELLEEALRLKRLKEYAGSPEGVVSINQLGPTVEVVSDSEIRAYGWCYRVDGVAPDLMPDEYQLTGREFLIEWFYAYGRMEGDRWTAMCIPADHVPAVE